MNFIVKKLYNIIRRNPLESIGVLLVSLFFVIGAAAPLLCPYSPTELNFANRFKPPSWEHLFGTDQSGRDIFSRVIAGSRVSLTIAFWVILVATSMGTIVGIIAGLAGGWVDEITMRLADIFLSFPPLILAMAISAALGAGIPAAITGLAVTWWPGYARLVRAQVLLIKSESYVEAARALGCGTLRLVTHHIIPNAINPLIVQITLDVGYVILAAAGLGFIGVGAQPPTPEWGTMIAAGREFILSKWWVSTFPGLALFLAVLGFNLFGDLLRNELDPRLRRRGWQ